MAEHISMRHRRQLSDNCQGLFICLVSYVNDTAGRAVAHQNCLQRS